MHAIAFACLLAAADPQVRMPGPGPTPPPPVNPAVSPQRLTPNTLFVITSPVEALILSSPEGLVRVSHDAGPLRIRGVFIDGPGSVETRTFAGPHVYTVEAVADGKVEVIAVVPGVGTAPWEVQRRTLVVDTGAGPRPPPDPPPQPPGPPAPAGFRVLMVFQDKDQAKYPPSQLASLYSRTVRDYLDAKCVKEPDGLAGYRIYDADVALGGEAKVWHDLMGRPRASLPWLVVTAGGMVAYEGPVPASVKETIDLLQKFGGAP